MESNALLPVTEALQRILSTICITQKEEVALTASLGRVTAESIYSRRTQPPQSVSAMDGYAIRTADLSNPPSKLKRVGTAPAGSAYSKTLQPGETVRIFTGAPIPNGADAVVIQENASAESEADGATVQINENPNIGQYIRPAGLDFKSGDCQIKSGSIMTARNIGLAAAMNVPWIAVRQKPKVAILATGDEIVRPGEPIGPHQIVSSNSYGLAALISASGGEPTILGVAKDKIEEIQNMVRGIRGFDLLITTGGASVGEHDLIQNALGIQSFGNKGLKVDFWRIAMRPGKPLIFGTLNEIPLLGLPGNPVSTFVCGLIFAQPAVKTMLGLNGYSQTTRFARINSSLPQNDRRQDYLRGELELNEKGEQIVLPFSHQDSSMLSCLAKADCLVVRPPFDPKKKPGDWVRIIEFSLNSSRI